MTVSSQTYQKGKVSIIIPVYNREILLPETLDSIMAQTYTNWECILVDDGSTDGSFSVCLEYARQDSRFKVYTRPASIRKGANGCRNFGFQQSDGEFIQWFDSDDLMEEGLLASHIRHFNSEVDLIVVKSKIFQDNLSLAQDVNLSESLVSKYIIHKILEGVEMFLTSQVIIKKSFLNKSFQLFDEELQRNQETEFFIRLLLHDAIVIKNFNSLVFIRGHLHSISGLYAKASENEKLKMNLPAYLKIYFNCKNKGLLTNELNKIFNDYFYRCLRKKAVEGIDYFKLYKLGLMFNWFPSKAQATRIFLNRFIVNV